MNAEFFDLFRVTVFKDKIIISKNEKHKIVDFIFNSEKVSKKIKQRKGDAWLGDTKGHEYLFNNKIMKNISKLVSEKVKLYTQMLNLDNNKLSFFYQRSWATITKNKERIQPHSHDQSNISFAFISLILCFSHISFNSPSPTKISFELGKFLWTSLKA